MHTNVSAGVCFVCEGTAVVWTPLYDSSVRLEWRIRDRVLACVSLSAASAVYCLPPSVTSWPQGGQGSEKVHPVSLCLDKFWQIYFATTVFPHPAAYVCSSLIDKIPPFPNLRMTHIVILKPSLGGADGSVLHELGPFICVVTQYYRQPNNERHNI